MPGDTPRGTAEPYRPQTFGDGSLDPDMRLAEQRRAARQFDYRMGYYAAVNDLVAEIRARRFSDPIEALNLQSIAYGLVPDLNEVL